MQYVGEELERLALSHGDAVNSDLLGRSAFNRYYYSAFLITRAMLGQMEASWKYTMHAGIPDLLRTSIRKKAKQVLAKQVAKGLMEKGKSSRLLTDVNTVSNELAELLESAYDARVIADYQPEVQTVREGNIIKLKTHKLTTAKEWPERAGILCGKLLKIWRDIGLA
ncbi:hypothetical protein [Alishewanella sp. HL-SH05]|uniref:hypothetical protein n=1 Tax=Alishewanella sp. HL-SH05 TaxID=3461145 RepID=UPI00404262E7